MTTKEIREEYQNNQEFYNLLFDEITKAKYKTCTCIDQNGNKRFDYLKMSEMYHNGDW